MGLAWHTDPWHWSGRAIILSLAGFPLGGWGGSSGEEQTSLHGDGMFSLGTARRGVWEGPGAAPSNLPSLEGLAGPQGSGEATLLLLKPCCALCYLCAVPWGPDLGHTEHRANLAPGPRPTPRCQRRDSSPFNTRTLSSNPSPCFFTQKFL